MLIDGVSWRILLEDIETLYQQQLFSLPAQTISYKHWSEYLQNYALQEQANFNLQYWLEQDTSRNYLLPTDFPNSENTIASSDTITVTLESEFTQILIQEIPEIYHTQINDILLTALVKTFAQYTNQSYLLVDLESQGRTLLETDLDISRTVGWFTNITPVLLDLEINQGYGNSIQTIKEQLQKAQKYSFNYNIARYLNSDSEISQKLTQIPQAQISFNYLGQFDNLLATSSLFEVAKESSGANYAASNKRIYLIEINSSVIAQKLQMQWIYPRSIYKSSTISDLANNFITVLKEIIIYCQSNTVEYTPSDFSLAELEQDDLELILDLVDFND